eukprot:5075455-Pleurochrysis_carterae.AAC.1
MVMWATHAGGCTTSLRDTPVKSSMYTCRYRGSACRASAGSSPRFCSSLRRAVQRCTAGGGGCEASKSACLRRTHAATSVEIRSNRLGAKAPPKLTRWSTMTPALPRESDK